MFIYKYSNLKLFSISMPHNLNNRSPILQPKTLFNTFIASTQLCAVLLIKSISRCVSALIDREPHRICIHSKSKHVLHNLNMIIFLGYNFVVSPSQMFVCKTRDSKCIPFLSAYVQTRSYFNVHSFVVVICFSGRHSI